MEKDLVSIVIPCYNGEKYIDDCLEAILKQTYKNIQLIIVDDGSKDQSLKKLKSYKKTFEKDGMQLIILTQDNQGQASAVNNALKKITGNYIMWQDIDDYYEPDAVESLLRFLKNNPEYPLVRAEAVFRDENNMEKIIKHAKSKYPNEEDIFKFYINEKDSYMYPGIFMIRTKHFDERIKDREIYAHTRAGQNWQLILPITYKARTGYLNKVVYNYRYVNNSHSHNIKNITDILNRCNQHKDLLIKVISSIKMDKLEFAKIKIYIKIKYMLRKLKIIIKYIIKKFLVMFCGKRS